MTALVVWMLVVVVAGLAVLGAVALPKLREGRPLLTQDGRARVERARRAAGERARDARRRASDLAGQAAERTRSSRTTEEPAVEVRERVEPREEPVREEPVPEPVRARAAAREDVVDLRTVESTATRSPGPLDGPTRPLAWEQEQAPGPRHARH
ncbi:hypothetical protein GCM10028777_37760 [Angustibacter speluncae]